MWVCSSHWGWILRALYGRDLPQPSILCILAACQRLWILGFQLDWTFPYHCQAPCQAPWSISYRWVGLNLHQTSQAGMLQARNGFIQHPASVDYLAIGYLQRRVVQGTKQRASLMVAVISPASNGTIWPFLATPRSYSSSSLSSLNLESLLPIIYEDQKLGEHGLTLVMLLGPILSISGWIHYTLLELLQWSSFPTKLGTP